MNGKMEGGGNGVFEGTKILRKTVKTGNSLIEVQSRNLQNICYFSCTNVIGEFR
jgi:hypothetical protein